MRILEFEQTRVPGIEELAVRVGLSPFHLSRVFAAQLGESCAAYSRRIRLDNSNNQLVHDAVPLDVVAATFGYQSQAAFTRAYTRQFGMPPRKFVATVLGRTRAEHAASHLHPVGGVDPDKPILRQGVEMVQRSDRPALARRFFGYDLASHWRCFLGDLPAGLVEGAAFAGLSYDNARVTPAAHWRYDCAVVFQQRPCDLSAISGASGLDVVEVPGGLHAEVSIDGDFADLWRTTIGLFTQWLPAHREYEPEGDPVVHWLGTAPSAAAFPATATIRVRHRGSAPAYNLRPLTRHGKPAGHRTNPAGS